MTTENKELIRCSCCKCKKLPEFFELKETTGLRLKTCIKCRSRFVCDYDNCEYKCLSNVKNDKKVLKQTPPPYSPKMTLGSSPGPQTSNRPGSNFVREQGKVESSRRGRTTRTHYFFWSTM